MCDVRRGDFVVSVASVRSLRAKGKVFVAQEYRGLSSLPAARGTGPKVFGAELRQQAA